MPEESQKKITTTDLKRKKYLLITLFLSNAITFVTSQDVKPLQNQTNLRVSSAAIKSSMKAQENTLLVKRRIGLNGNFISGETISTQMLGKCYNALTDDFSSAQFILSKKKIIITSPDLYSSYVGDFMSTQAYVDELLKIEGRINVQYNKIEIEGGGLYENTFKDEKSTISLFQIGYDQYEAVEFNQNILQSKWAYRNSKFLHHAAGTSKEKLDNFVATHGNYYVNKVTTGIFAVRQVKFDFGSEENKLKIEADVKGKIDLKALSIEFSARVKKADEETRKALTISVKQGTIGGDPIELQVNFKESFDKIESVLLDSWNNFFRKSSENKTKYASALSAELVLISSAVHPAYSRSQDDSAQLHRKYKEARERISNLQSHRLRIDMALKRTQFMIEGLGYGAPGSIRELLRPLKSMGDDFKTYHLTKVLNKFEDYLSLGENYILNNPIPNDELSDLVDINNPDKNWLKDKHLKLDFGTMEEIFTLLEGSGRIQGKIGTANVLIDGPVAWGEPAGVPNELLFYYENDVLEDMTIQEKNSKWVFKYKGEQWNLFTGMPKRGSLPIPRNSEHINFADLPVWLSKQKYFMTKKFENETYTRSYTGFFRKNEFFDEGVLTNEGFKGPDTFHSCDVKWSGDYHLHMAKAFILQKDVIYTGEVKYNETTMIFTMHGDGEIRYANTNGTVDKGTWDEGEIVVDNKKDFLKLQPYLHDLSRVRKDYPSSQPTVIPSTQPTVTPSTQPTPMPSTAPSTQPTPTPSTAPTITTSPSVQKTPAPTPSRTPAPTTLPPSTAPTTINKSLCVPLQFISVNPPDLLSQCQGDCDVDSDCKDGMVCFQRHTGGGVPGCAGNPHADHYDYCIRKEDRATTPPSVQTTPTPTTLLPSTAPTTINKSLCVPLQYISADPSDLLSQCQGDCDADSDCEDGMVCFHRETGGGVPGCAGNPNSNIADYCIREEDRTTIETVYFFGGSKRITQSVDGQPDAVVINPPTDYSLRFTIELKDVKDVRGSIIHFTTGGNWEQYGRRVPAIFLYAHTTKMQVYTGDNSDGDRYHNLPYELELHKKHSIEVHVYGTKSSVYVNGNLVAQMTIGTRAQLDQVNVYIGDPWHDPANAVISDISFTEAVDNTPTFVSDYFYSGSQLLTQSVDGQPNAVVINPPTDYSLRFTIEQKGVIDGWGSIIHFTTGGNNGQYGQRVPGIWFSRGSTKLYVTTADDSDDENIQDLPYELELNKKHSIEVHVYGTRASVYVNGALASQMTIGTRTQLEQVNIYIGDPWYEPANATISDISFTEAVDNTPTFVSNYFYSGSQLLTRSVDGQPDAVVINPPTDYSLRFTIEPKGVIDGHGTIIHFTTGGDWGKYGQRGPAIWFNPGSTQLQVDSDDSDYFKRQDLPYELELNKKHPIEVHVYGMRASVYVNGALASQVTIGTRTQLDQVNVYIGDPWYEAANAVISDIIFTKAVEYKL